MTSTKFVCRLLDADNQLLGWCEHMAHIPGDGTICASKEVIIPVDKEGFPTQVSLHWVDVNVESRSDLPDAGLKVEKGARIHIFQRDDPMIKIGDPPVGLPMVTVKSVSV